MPDGYPRPGRHRGGRRPRGDGRLRGPRQRAPEAVAVITAVAAGAILTMIADTMIPEAFERTRTWTGVITTVGCLVAFTIEQLGA